MISAKTWYKSYNNKLLVIIEAFITWQYYLKDCKYKVLVFTNHNNFCRFMDIKNLSFCQVWWAPMFSCYYLWIDYNQEKANRATDTLSCFLHQDDKEKDNFWDENTWILYCLQCSLTNTSISKLNAIVSRLLSHHQVLIHRTYVLP